MIQAELFDGTSKLKSVQYFYDALGRRIKKSVQDLAQATSHSRKYVYDSSEIIAELDEDNSVLARYTHSSLRTDDVLSAEITSDGVARGYASVSGSYLYLKDGTGSIEMITTDTGNIIQRFIYSSYGKLLKIVDAIGVESNEIRTAFSYTNRELDDETGLYYYRARYYDAYSGRFLQEDPHAGNLSNPSTINSSYSYVSNNPINRIDPSGAISISVGSISFNASSRSVLAFFSNPLMILVKPFLSGADSIRFDKFIIASSAIIVAAIIAPEFAILAAASSAFKNRGTGGNFFDSLDQYTTDFTVAFAISYGLSLTGLKFFAAPTTEAAYYDSAVAGITIQYGREILRRSKKERDIITPILLFGGFGPGAFVLAPVVGPLI